jgi:hypothetical protein
MKKSKYFALNDYRTHLALDGIPSSLSKEYNKEQPQEFQLKLVSLGFSSGHLSFDFLQLSDVVLCESIDINE